MSDLAEKKQAAIEALTEFDDPASKPPAGVMIGFKVPVVARETLRELSRAGVNPSAVMRQKLAEWLAEVDTGNGRA